MPEHTIQCFQLQKSASNQLGKLNTAFFWKKSNVEKGLSLIVWEKICIPKTKGGLGFCKMDDVNEKLSNVKLPGRYSQMTVVYGYNP